MTARPILLVEDNPDDEALTLRALGKNHIAILTSSAEQRDIVASYGLSANSYVRKPVNFEEFLESTRQIGLYWLLLNTSPYD